MKSLRVIVASTILYAQHPGVDSKQQQQRTCLSRRATVESLRLRPDRGTNRDEVVPDIDTPCYLNGRWRYHGYVVGGGGGGSGEVP